MRCFFLLSLVFALASAKSILYLEDRGDPSQYVQEFAIRKIKAGVSFETFNTARMNALDLLCTLDGIMACTEWQGIFTIDSSLQLNNVTEDGWYIGLYQYESVAAFNNVSAAMHASPVLAAFIDTVDMPCFSVEMGTNGTLIDTNALPYPPALVEATVVNIKPGQEAAYDSTVMPYMNWKDTVPGVGDGKEYIQYIPSYNASIRAVTNTYTDVDALMGFLGETNPAEAAFFPTFDLACSVFMERLDMI